MFNIPMNSKPALSLDALANMTSGGGSAVPMNNMGQQTMQNNWNQQAVSQGNQNNWGNQSQPQSNWGQPAPQVNQYNQQNNWNQQAPQANQYQQNNWGQTTNQVPQHQQSAPMQNNMSKQRPNATGVILKKGQKQSLTKMNPNLDLIHVGLGWDLTPGGQSYDLDVEAFLLNADNKVIGDDWFVFYNQPDSPDGAVKLLQQSSNGAGAGDDEVIQVKLSQVNPQVNKILFIVTINDAKEYGYNFSNVQNAYVRIVDVTTNKELVRFNLTDYYNTVCSMMVGEVYKRNGEWRFNPIGDGTGDDLMGLCVRYGVNVAG